MSTSSMNASTGAPAGILQFGTSRFLQAHADLMLAEARAAGQPVGPLTLVETTGSPASRARITAFRESETYPVRIRGLVDGRTIDEERQVPVPALALSAREEGERLREIFLGDIAYVVSNTGDRGFETPAAPRPTLDGWTSFAELLTALLHERFRAGGAGLVLMPCELIERNGERLAATIASVAERGGLPEAFRRWVDERCIFVNALVDRIVSEPIEPIGAVAEPYALWAVERQPGFVPPAEHPDILPVDDLDFIEKRKLFLLNLGHTMMAERWLKEGGPAGATVREMMADAAVRDFLDTIMAEEIIPVFGPRRDEAADYWRICRDRFANPFLNHRIADIAQNHAAKIERRAGGLIRWQRRTGEGGSLARLEALFPEAVR